MLRISPSTFPLLFPLLSLFNPPSFLFLPTYTSVTGEIFHSASSLCLFALLSLLTSDLSHDRTNCTSVHCSCKFEVDDHI